MHVFFLHNCTGKQRKWPVPSELTLELIEYIWSINQQLSTKNDYLGPNMGVAENFPFLDGNNFPFDWIMKKIFFRTYFFLFPRNTNQLMSANMLAFFFLLTECKLTSVPHRNVLYVVVYRWLLLHTYFVLFFEPRKRKIDWANKAFGNAMLGPDHLLLQLLSLFNKQYCL